MEGNNQQEGEAQGVAQGVKICDSLSETNPPGKKDLVWFG